MKFIKNLRYFTGLLFFLALIGTPIEVQAQLDFISSHEVKGIRANLPTNLMAIHDELIRVVEGRVSKGTLSNVQTSDDPRRRLFILIFHASEFAFEGVNSLEAALKTTPILISHREVMGMISRRSLKRPLNPREYAHFSAAQRFIWACLSSGYTTPLEIQTLARTVDVELHYVDHSKPKKEKLSAQTLLHELWPTELALIDDQNGISNYWLYPASFDLRPLPEASSTPLTILLMQMTNVDVSPAVRLNQVVQVSIELETLIPWANLLGATALTQSTKATRAKLIQKSLEAQPSRSEELDSLFSSLANDSSLKWATKINAKKFLRALETILARYVAERAVRISRMAEADRFDTNFQNFMNGRKIWTYVPADLEAETSDDEREAYFTSTTDSRLNSDMRFFRKLLVQLISEEKIEAPSKEEFRPEKLRPLIAKSIRLTQDENPFLKAHLDAMRTLARHKLMKAQLRPGEEECLRNAQAKVLASFALRIEADTQSPPSYFDELDELELFFLLQVGLYNPLHQGMDSLDRYWRPWKSYYGGLPDAILDPPIRTLKLRANQILQLRSRDDLAQQIYGRMQIPVEIMRGVDAIEFQLQLQSVLETLVRKNPDSGQDLRLAIKQHRPQLYRAIREWPDALFSEIYRQSLQILATLSSATDPASSCAKELQQATTVLAVSEKKAGRR